MSALTSGNLVVRLGFNGMDNVGELDGVLNEEHGYVVTDDVPVPFVRVELNRKPTNVANSILRDEAGDYGIPSENGDVRTALPREPWTDMAGLVLALSQGAKSG